MKKIGLGLLAAVAVFGLNACGDYDSSTSPGESTTVNVNNEGDGDVTVNTGSGTVVINSEGECLVVLNEDESRACTEDEAAEVLDTIESNAFELYDKIG